MCWRNNLRTEDYKATLGTHRVGAAERKKDRVAELEAAAFRWLARSREANIEIGRAFNELKKILGHGEWQRHFKEKFAERITLRTAERYMEQARNADADSKTDRLTIFEAATDQDAEDIRETTEEALVEMATAAGRKKMKKSLRHIYKLPLRMTAEERQAAEALQTVPEWPRAEKAVLALLRRLSTKYGVARDK
jgi:Protein of unknown function (DUF3102)